MTGQTISLAIGVFHIVKIEPNICCQIEKLCESHRILLQNAYRRTTHQTAPKNRRSKPKVICSLYLSVYFCCGHMVMRSRYNHAKLSSFLSASWSDAWAPTHKSSKLRMKEYNFKHQRKRVSRSQTTTCDEPNLTLSCYNCCSDQRSSGTSS